MKKQKKKIVDNNVLINETREGIHSRHRFGVDGWMAQRRKK